MPDTPTIRLDQFLKLADVVQSGGEAKQLIQSGEVIVNGEVETRRKKQLKPGRRSFSHPLSLPPSPSLPLLPPWS